MKKGLIVIGLCMVLLGVRAQEVRSVMSKEEMEEFAEIINELVLGERYEEAVVLYSANRDIVNPKTLCRQDRGWWKETAEELEGRLAVYEGNRERIERAVKWYEEGEYRRSWDEIRELRCDSSAAYRETLERLQGLRDSLEEKRTVMEMLDSRMVEYIAKFKAGTYYDLYVLLDIEHLAGYVAEKDVAAVKEMVETLQKEVKERSAELVMSGTKLTKRQIAEMSERDVSKLLYLLKLDVIHYYGMLFDTEGQITRYKQSEEYAQKKEEMEKERERAMKRLYSQEESVEMGEYNADEGCFEVMIGSNKGTELTYFNYATAAPQKAFGKRFEKVVHEALKVTSRADKAVVERYVNGEKYLQHYVKVKVGKEAAERIAGKRCRMVICFVPEGVRRYEFEGAELYYVNKTYNVFEVRDDFPYTTKCRVMIYTEEGEMVYDEVIK